MGYWTQYKLQVEIPDTVEDPYGMADEIRNTEFSYGTYDRLMDGGDEMKWYGHEDEMTTLSKKFPEVTFILFGDGDAGGDLWRFIFKGGKSVLQRVEITFPPWSETDLT